MGLSGGGKEYREELLSVLEVGEAGYMLEGVGDNEGSQS